MTGAGPTVSAGERQALEAKLAEAREASDFALVKHWSREAAFDGRYNLAYGSAAPSTTCTAKCSALQVARMDLGAWRAYVSRLPAGESELTVSNAGEAEVKVRWADTRDVSNKLEIVTMVQL